MLLEKRLINDLNVLMSTRRHARCGPLRHTMAAALRSRCATCHETERATRKQTGLPPGVDRSRAEVCEPSLC
eukprot:366564-Chlamydomonas_euryale.AAC.9